MTKRSKFSAIRKAFGTGILTCILFAVSPDMNAQTSSTTDSTVKSATMQYVGTSANMAIFRIQFTNVKNEKFCVTVHGGTDDVLYEKVYSDQNFDKQFNIPADAGKLNITITELNNYTAQTFEIDTHLRMNDVVFTAGNN
jgi:hypothetical protein